MSTFIYFDGESTDDIHVRGQYGFFCTPCTLPESTPENEQQARELLSRYVGDVSIAKYGADCVAFGIWLGRMNRAGLNLADPLAGNPTTSPA